MRQRGELYGKEEAKKCCASMYDFSLALNDSTKILIPYCYCIDASKIVTEVSPKIILRPRAIFSIPLSTPSPT